MLDNLGYKDYVSEINTKFQLVETEFEIELIEVTEKNYKNELEFFSNH